MSRENKRRSVNTANLKQMAEKSVNNSRVSYQREHCFLSPIRME